MAAGLQFEVLRRPHGCFIDGKRPPSFRDALGAPTEFSEAVVE